MSNYSTITAAIIEQVQNRENDLPLRNEACASKFFFHAHPTSKVFLFFHGFTAGPYQFEALGRVLFEAGYNVLIPLQPGHGYAGEWDKRNPPPLPTEPEVYQRFALEWLKIAQTLGKEVIVGGLSGGGTLAAWLAVERPQHIDKAILFAPYLSGSNKVVDFLVEALPFYFEWLNKDNSGNFGYDGFRIPALKLFLDLGQEISERVQNNLDVPMFIIVSESDKAINHDEIWDFFGVILQHQPKSWYHCFDKAFDIPHTMMTKAEGNNYRNLLITLVKAYVESDLTWADVIEIAAQILQGKTFDAAVNELNFAERVSPNLSVMLTVMDKQLIIDASK